MSLELPGNTAEALRRAFDHSFATARGAERPEYESILAIRIAGHPYAVRLREIASLQADRRIVAFPSHIPYFLGLIGLRGVMVPVYDLRAMLGYTVVPDPRWLLLVRAPELVGLGFDLFEAHLRMEPGQHSSTHAEVPPAQHVSGLVRTAEATRPLIHIASLLQAIAACADAVNSKEP
jgi:purine-binding chemotaxis protein CheW